MQFSITPSLVSGRAINKALPYLWLFSPNDDFTFSFNLHFAELLAERKIPFELHTAPGGHEWRYWDAQLPDLLRKVDEVLAIRS